MQCGIVPGPTSQLITTVTAVSGGRVELTSWVWIFECPVVVFCEWVARYSWPKRQNGMDECFHLFREWMQREAKPVWRNEWPLPLTIPFFPSPFYPLFLSATFRLNNWQCTYRQLTRRADLRLPPGYYMVIWSLTSNVAHRAQNVPVGSTPTNANEPRSRLRLWARYVLLLLKWRKSCRIFQVRRVFQSISYKVTHFCAC